MERHFSCLKVIAHFLKKLLITDQSLTFHQIFMIQVSHLIGRMCYLYHLEWCSGPFQRLFYKREAWFLLSFISLHFFSWYMHVSSYPVVDQSFCLSGTNMFQLSIGAFSVPLYQVILISIDLEEQRGLLFIVPSWYYFKQFSISKLI